MKFLYILLLSFFMPLMANSQTIYQNSVMMETSNYNMWLQCENAGHGKGSFGIITSTNGKKANDGYYYYDVYLINNSFYRNGNTASSYIKNINVYVLYGGKWMNVINFSYALVPPASETFDGYFHLTYIYDVKQVQKIKVTWSEVTPY